MPIDAERYRQLALCAGGGGFEAVPRGPMTLDLALLQRRLSDLGVATVDARVLLIATLEAETTISRGGRLLFKTRDRAVADRLFARLRPLLEPAVPARTR